MQPSLRGLNILQKISMSLMGLLVLITFLGTNLQAVLWQSSDWLVSTVLPAVVVKLTNEERASINAAPLQRNATLDAAAKLKAEDMAKNEYFAHFSPTGVSPWHWFDQAGYVYAHAGENLAIHFTDSSEVVEAWMDSPTHRQNIVNGLYTEIGVGTAKGKFDGYDTVYVVQLFGTPGVVPAKAPVVQTPEPKTVAVSEPVVVPEVTTLPAAAEEVLSAESVANESLPAPVEIESVKSETVPVISESEVATAASEVIPEAVPDDIPDSKPSFETVSTDGDVVIIESPIISTSSGLAVANITTLNDSHAGATAASIATQPNELLQIIYMVLGVVILLLLGASIVMEARRLRFVQVAYGVLLLFGMGGLWFINSLLTSGAVIV